VVPGRVGEEMPRAGGVMSALRVALVDDHTLLRAGIRALLEKVPGIEVVGEASNGREALDLIKTELPGLVLMDIAMRELGGLEALALITKQFPSVKVIILSAHANEEFVIRALRSGAAGYMLKDAAAEELGLAMHAIAEGKPYLSSSISRKVIDNYLDRVGGVSPSTKQLTARQSEVLRSIAEGKNTKEIASLLGISVKTVEAHRLQLMGRLGIYDVPGLVKYAIRFGLVSSDA
jgi:DNA-binding NarL/FixJ family response regulator